MHGREELKTNDSWRKKKKKNNSHFFLNGQRLKINLRKEDDIHNKNDILMEGKRKK